MHLTVGLSSVGFVKRKKVLKEGKKLAVRLFFFISIWPKPREYNSEHCVSMSCRSEVNASHSLLLVKEIKCHFYSSY